MSMSLKGGILEYRNMLEPSDERYMENTSPKGRKVKFNNSGGWDHDLKFANQFFSEGDILTVDEIYVGRSSSKVKFIEVPHKTFNTVMFDDVE